MKEKKDIYVKLVIVPCPECGATTDCSHRTLISTHKYVMGKG